MSTGTRAVRVDVHLTEAETAAALRADVASGLTASPKTLPPKWFYDERGSQLFDAITRLDEYYPTRAERSILRARAHEVAALTGSDTLVELGSGTSEKARLLLDALRRAATLRRFVPFDVSEETLRGAAAAILHEYPGLEVHAVVGDFERHLGTVPRAGRRLVAFLGGTIGNLEPTARGRFLRGVAAELRPGEHFLLGADLVKEPERIVRAYDDAAGLTAAFNKNVLAVVNRALGASFDLDGFDHVVRWDAGEEWIEMRLRARAASRVAVPGAGIEAAFAAGEELRTEISAKFRRAGLETELATAGLEPRAWWTDPAGDFALSLSAV